jgi:oligosaccharyltransferase complex subunit epsilon
MEAWILAALFSQLISQSYRCFYIQPFNAFLSGFSAAVGQFVLTASLRMQTSDSGSGSSSKPSSKGKNARFADEDKEEQSSGTSHER